VVAEAPTGEVFILLSHVVPELAADEVGKEPRRVCSANGVRMLGSSNKRQPVGITGANKPPGVGLGKQGKEPCDVMEVFWDNVRGTRSQGVEMTVLFSGARRDQVDVRRTNW
jgi:hypothetical protein